METTFTGKSRYAVEKAIELAKTRDGARWDVSTDVKDGRFAQWKKPARAAPNQEPAKTA